MIKGVRFFSGIGRKLLCWFLLLSILPVIMVAILTYRYARETIKNELLNEEAFLADGIKNHILTILNAGEYSSQFFASDEFIRRHLEILNHQPDNERIVQKFNDYMVYKTNLNKDFYETFVLNNAGIIVASSNGNRIGKIESGADYFTHGKAGTYVKDIYLDESTGEYSLAFAAPILKKRGGKFLGILVIRFDANKLNEITTGKRTVGKEDAGSFLRRGKTSEAYIVNKNHLLITHSRFTENAILQQPVNTQPVATALNAGREVVGVYKNYMGRNVIGATRYLKKIGWVLLVETDESEAYSPISRFKYRAITMAGICIVGVIFVSFFVSRGIINPIILLVNGMKRVAAGDLNFRVETHLKDELGELTASFNHMTDDIKDSREKLVQSDRLASIGQLVAGIAHEINNPVGVIYLYSTESLKLFERVTNALKRISALPITKDMQRLNGAIACLDNSTNGERKTDILRKELLSITDDLDKNCKELDEIYAVISKTRSFLHEYLEGSVKESIRCKDLISGLLDFSRQKKPEMGLANINTIIDNVLNIVEKQYRKEKIEVVRETGQNIPDIMMDIRQMEQVVINITNNAVFAMKDFGENTPHAGVYRKGALTVGSCFHPEKELVEIYIKDTGVGIRKNDMGKIFDPFFTTRKDGKGTGLGLSISYGIVKMHDGGIEVESEVGKGTTFRILLPLKAKKEQEARVVKL